MAIAYQAIPALICPSDNHPGRLALNRANVANVEWGVTNYKGVGGSNWQWGGFPTNAAGSVWLITKWGNSGDMINAGNGIFFPGRLHDTAVAPPKAVRPASARMGDITDGTSNTLMIGEAVPQWCTHTWWWWHNAVTGTTAIPPNALDTTCGNYNAANSKEQNLFNCRTYWQGNYSFFSRHTGGVQFALADGSVRFISDNIDLTVYRNAGTMGGGEVSNLQ